MKIRRFDNLVSGEAKIAVALVIGYNYQDVWLFTSRPVRRCFSVQGKCRTDKQHSCSNQLLHSNQFLHFSRSSVILVLFHIPIPGARRLLPIHSLLECSDLLLF